MKEIIKKNKEGIKSATIFLLVSAVLLVIGFYLSSNRQDYFVNIFASIGTSILFAIIIAFYINWELGEPDDISILEPKKIGNELDKVLNKSSQWQFIGCTGTFQRNSVMPYLKENYTKSKSFDGYSCILIDISNEKLCQKYAEYRNDLNGSEWGDASKVLNATAATILKAIDLQKTTNGRVEVFLSPLFSTFRIDIGNEYLVRTCEGKGDKGVKIGMKNFMFNLIRNEFRQLSSQCKRIDFSNVTSIKINKNNCIQILNSIGISSDMLSEDLIWKNYEGK